MKKLCIILFAALWLTGCDRADKIQLSVSSLEFLFSDEEQTFTINSNTEWTVDISGDITWLTVTPPSGTGNGTVTVTVAPNPSAAPRTATITVSGGEASQTFTVTQTGAPPTLSVSADSLAFAHIAESRTFTLSSNADWTVGSSEPAWLTVSPASGTNDSTITVTAAANPARTERTATVTVSGEGINQAIGVKQAGIPDFLTVSPTEINIAPSSPAGTTYPLTVESNTDWTVTKGSETWFTLTPASGSGNGTVQITAQNNSTASQRTATITVSGGGITRTVTLTQIAAGLSLSENAFTFTSSAGQQIITVSSNISWTVSSNQGAWLTVTPSSGSNNGTITVTAAANSSTSQRTGTVTVSGNGLTRTVAVTQRGVSYVNVSPASLAFTSASDSKTFAVSSNVSWTVEKESSTPWLTVSPSTGINGGTVTVSVTANTSTSPRTAEITVTGDGITRTVEVTQARFESLTVSTATLSFLAAGGNNTFTVSSNTNWTVNRGTATWLTLSASSGSNNGTITVTADANPTALPRTATITISSTGLTPQTIAVTQAGVAATLSLSESALNFVAVGENKTFNVTSNTSWSVSSNLTWLTVTPSSGLNNGTVTLTAAANPSASTRGGMVGVTGSGLGSISLINVTQAAAEEYLTLSTEGTMLLTFVGAGEDKTFNVTSNTTWSVSSDEPSWFTVDPSSGSNNATVTITANPFYGAPTAPPSRGGIITVVSEGGITKPIIVIQWR